jgi:ABC-type arginine transport system permease subunit
MRHFGISRVEGVAAGISALAAPLAVLLAFGFEYAAFAVAREWRNPPGWFVIVLNTVPSVLAGALVYGGAAAALRRWCSDAETTRWLPRNGVPLLLVGALAALIIIDWSYPDFWMVAQFLIFPLSALVGGISADTMIWTKLRREVSHAAA